MADRTGLRWKGLTLSLLTLLCVSLAPPAWAQQASGISGVVRDSSGSVLPGVSVEAASPALIEKSITVVTDGEGRYSVVDLRPGNYTVTFSLVGFSTVKREGVVLRASANFQVERVVMRVGGLEESITVSGRSPMVEVSNPSTVMNVDAEFQKAEPLTEGGFWTDFLQMTPGVLSRPHNDGSGR